MKRIWAQNISSGVMEADISGTNICPDGCKRYLTDDYWRQHESGEPLYIADGDKHRERTEAEIKGGAKYKAWFNAKIEAQLQALDIKRIRPSAEINDDDTSAQDKTAAEATLKTLNAQAATLRAQIIK